MIIIRCVEVYIMILYSGKRFYIISFISWIYKLIRISFISWWVDIMTTSTSWVVYIMTTSTTWVVYIMTKSNIRDHIPWLYLTQGSTLIEMITFCVKVYIIKSDIIHSRDEQKWLFRSHSFPCPRPYSHSHSIPIVV